METEKQWDCEGFSSATSQKLEELLMNDKTSYWFHYRSIPWYKIRRIKIENPSVLKKIVLEELNIYIEVVVTKKTGHLFSKWIIKPINLEVGFFPIKFS